MTLVRYSLGMAGNGNEAGKGWAEETTHLLRELVNEAVFALCASPIAAGDVVAADRRARAVVNIARAVKTVEALKALARQTRTQAETPEDEMGEQREYDPEQLAALREDVFSRCVELRNIIDRKRAARDVERRGAGGDPRGDPEADGAPDRDTVGLADLADAGGPGGGQDLRGGLLAA